MLTIEEVFERIDRRAEAVIGERGFDDLEEQDVLLMASGLDIPMEDLWGKIQMAMALADNDDPQGAVAATAMTFFIAGAIWGRS